MTAKAYVVALCGAGDRPVASLDGRTPLEVAHMPNLDRLTAGGRLGLVEVIGEGIAPESDSGAMALLGYDPLRAYTGRGALEGLGLGFLDPADPCSSVCFRINFASYDEGRGHLDRRTARDLSLEEQAVLVRELRAGVRLPAWPDVTFQVDGFGGHRGILCFRSPGRALSGNVTNTDPGFRRVGAFGVYNEHFDPQPVPCRALDDTPAAALAARLVEDFLAEAHELLRRSAVNARRAARGQLPANVLLLRDGGHRAPSLPTFRERHGLSLAVYGQIPAERGLCRLLGGTWTSAVPPPSGLEAYYHDLAARLLREPAQVVFVHVKGPDEPAHDGRVAEKVAALEQIDRELMERLVRGMGEGDVLVVTCDHRTPCELGIHTADPVPLLLAGGGLGRDGSRAFTEAEAEAGDLGFGTACELIGRLRPALETQVR
ncbi:MAG TPA: CMP-5'-phosphonoformate--3-phosphoglycerate phosphonoformyl transferase [Methylomirabilota bacterium]|nr:CMP-5'-phosphonoformate--3-phosphoglycerate phosphonoformyl transferase [Methylomirabilota bacterium]